MAKENYQTQDSDALKKALLDLRKAQLNLRFRKNTSEVQNTAEMRKNKRNIARVKTILHARKTAQS